MASGKLIIGTYGKTFGTVHGKMVVGYYGPTPPTITGKLIIGTFPLVNTLSLQTIKMVGSDIAGDVQLMNAGKNDDSVPIFYELETQELEFGNRAFTKNLGDKLGVISQEASDSKIQIKGDDGDYKDIQINLTKRVNIGNLPNIKSHYTTLKWSGNTESKAPILEGFFFNDIKPDGI